MDINTIITDYIRAAAEQAAAEKTAREAKKRREIAAAEILRHAAGRESFGTDQYTVGIKTEARRVLDTEKLLRDFPEAKELNQYGRDSVRQAITALPREASGTKTA